jgi:uncharacterized protein (DUF736 family)
MSEEKKQPIGALWDKRTKNGELFMTGTVTIDGTEHRLAIWGNRYKKEDKHPDWRVFIDTYEPSQRTTTPAPRATPAPIDVPATQPMEDDDLPF